MYPKHLTVCLNSCARAALLKAGCKLSTSLVKQKLMLCLEKTIVIAQMCNMVIELLLPAEAAHIS